MCGRITYWFPALPPIIAAVLYCFLSDTGLRTIEDCYDLCKTGHPEPNTGVVIDYAAQSTLVYDVSLQMLRGYLKKNNYDPISIDDIHVHTTESVLGIQVNIKLEGTSLILGGLSSLQRTHDVIVTTAPNNMVNLKTYISMTNLYIEGAIKLKAGIFKSKIHTISIDSLKVFLELEFPRSDYGQPSVKRLDIHDVGKIKLHARGEKVVNDVLTKYATRIANTFRENIKQEVAPTLFDSLNSTLTALGEVF